MWRWRFCLSLNMHSWCCAFAIRFWCLCCTTVLPIQSPLCPLGEKPVSERGNLTRIEATATWLWAKGSSPICAGSTYKDESERISYWYPLFEHLLATVSVRLHYLGDQNIKVKTCQDHSQVRSDVTHYHGKKRFFPPMEHNRLIWNHFLNFSWKGRFTLLCPWQITSTVTCVKDKSSARLSSSKVGRVKWKKSTLPIGLGIKKGQAALFRVSTNDTLMSEEIARKISQRQIKRKEKSRQHWGGKSSTRSE